MDALSFMYDDAAAPTPGAGSLAERAELINARLARTYPQARCALNYRNPFELLIATVLSAQSTDVRVNSVTPELFSRFPTPAALAAADRAEVEALIRPLGMQRQRTTSLLGIAAQLLADHGGRVPATLKELTALPGVGRKTANVVLGNAFDIPGITVDTHVGRVSRRLALVSEKAKTALAAEKELMEVIPRSQWTIWCHRMIFHGRQVCHARKPECEKCVLADLCPSAGTV